MIKKIFILLLWFLANNAFSQTNSTEQIINFQSHIRVIKNALVIITEDIAVNAQDQQIKHGIARWLPIQYTDSMGFYHHVYYEVQHVLINGQPVSYHTELENNKLVIYIGNKNIVLQPGRYHYTLQYQVRDALNFLRDGDELYWNITGNDWTLPINQAKATIQLPAAAKIVQYAGFTGKKNEAGKDFTVILPTANQIIFKTNQILLPGSGLTIAIAWPKGVVVQLPWYLQLTLTEKVMSWLLLFTFMYFVYVWYQHGMDPRRGTIVPLFAPPNDISAAKARYILEMGFDNKTLTAAIISLASKGALIIQDQDDKFILNKNNFSANLTYDERDLYTTLFSTQDTIAIDKTNNERIEKAKAALNVALEIDAKDNYFILNFKYLLPGLIILAIVVVTITITALYPGLAVTEILQASIVPVLLVWLMEKGMKRYFEQGLPFYAWLGLALLIVIMSWQLPFIKALIVYLTATTLLPPITLYLIMAFVFLNSIFYFLLKRPTLLGRKIMDQLEGFKLYLATTERYRLASYNPPILSKEIFEKYLPYALAFNVENQWSEKFNNELRQAGMAPDGYQPIWYSGRNWQANNLTTMPGMLVTSLNSAVSQLLSSSASSGRGSSGGGGGGGGGGGW